MSVFYLHSGEEAAGFTLAYGNTMCIDGGRAVDARSYGAMLVETGGSACNITIDGYYDSTRDSCVAGKMEVRQGGIASGISVLGLADNEYQSLAKRIFNGKLTVCGGMAVDITVSAFGRLEITSGMVNGLYLSSNANCSVGSDGMLGGKLTLQRGCKLEMAEGSVLDFAIAGVAPEESALLNDFSRIPDEPSLTVTVSGDQSFGHYCLAGNAANFDRSMTVKANDVILSEISLAQAGGSDATQCVYVLTLEDSSLWLEVKPKNGEFTCVPNADGVSYAITLADTVGPGLLAQKNGGVLQTNVAKSATLWNLGGGELVLSVEGGLAEETIENAASADRVARASGKTQSDVFLANVTGKWKNDCVAANVGVVNAWQGTGERADLKGRNVIGSIFEGGEAEAYALLCLTDDANGDALFLDDIYTELPESVTEAQARIARIDEIRAGAGDDVVDLTSQVFEYAGMGMTIRGGLGDDVLWANKGENRLFGDAGNDRLVGASGDDLLAGGIGNDSMHGGGGEDLFCFCENWGNDIVQQVSGGKVTLWFASGNESLWNAETMTYTDGTNSVVVSGVEASEVTLKFGDGDDDRYGSLLAAGAFDAFTSEKIFEDKDKGLLA